MITSICPSVYLIENFLPPSIVDNIVDKLEKECHWGAFTINNKTLCRTGCFQGDQLENGSTPWLRCPSIEHQTIYPWTPTVQQIKDIIEGTLGFATNIGKIQKYKDGHSFIHLHSDKIIDLEPGSPILVARFGAARTCVLKHKTRDEVHWISVPHNSCLVIDYDANLEWKHGIQKENEINEASYSIVFRNSVTFRASEEEGGYIYGEHTPSENDRQPENLMTYEDYTKKIVKCYAQENRQSDVTLDIYKEIMEKSIFPF